jgi:uncharacterized repeat protein (TIGR01451 family)
MTGPDNGIVGVPITFQVTVTNPGTGPATNAVLTDSFDPGLEHESKANPVELKIGTLEAGQNVTKTLNLTPRDVGRFFNRVTATADGNLSAKAEHPVTVQLARLAITMTGPKVRYVSKAANWDIQVSNPGDVPLTNVVVRDQLPPDLGFVSASEGGQPSDGQVAWNIGTLQPREQKLLRVTTNCLRITEKALNVAVATADPGLQAQAEAAVEIRGLPAFMMEVRDLDDPIEVGARTTYEIKVTNQGSLPGNQVEIKAFAPEEMRIISANGPSTPRIEGRAVTFPPVDGLQPKQTFTYTVEVEALEPGDVRFRVELLSQTLGTIPVVEEESTRIYSTGEKPAQTPGTNVPGSPGLPSAPPSSSTPIGPTGASSSGSNDLAPAGYSNPFSPAPPSPEPPSSVPPLPSR